VCLARLPACLPASSSKPNCPCLMAEEKAAPGRRTAGLSWACKGLPAASCGVSSCGPRRWPRPGSPEEGALREKVSAASEWAQLSLQATGASHWLALSLSASKEL